MDETCEDERLTSITLEQLENACKSAQTKRKMMLRLHPDKHQSPACKKEAEEMFKRFNNVCEPKTTPDIMGGKKFSGDMAYVQVLIQRLVTLYNGIQEARDRGGFIASALELMLKSLVNKVFQALFGSTDSFVSATTGKINIDIPSAMKAMNEKNINKSFDVLVDQVKELLGPNRPQNIDVLLKNASTLFKRNNKFSKGNKIAKGGGMRVQHGAGAASSSLAHNDDNITSTSLTKQARQSLDSMQAAARQAELAATPIGEQDALINRWRLMDAQLKHINQKLDEANLRQRGGQLQLWKQQHEFIVWVGMEPTAVVCATLICMFFADAIYIPFMFAKGVMLIVMTFFISLTQFRAYIPEFAGGYTEEQQAKAASKRADEMWKSFNKNYMVDLSDTIKDFAWGGKFLMGFLLCMMIYVLLCTLFFMRKIAKEGFKFKFGSAIYGKFEFENFKESPTLPGMTSRSNKLRLEDNEDQYSDASVTRARVRAPVGLNKNVKKEQKFKRSASYDLMNGGHRRRRKSRKRRRSRRGHSKKRHKKKTRRRCTRRHKRRKCKTRNRR